MCTGPVKTYNEKNNPPMVELSGVVSPKVSFLPFF